MLISLAPEAYRKRKTICFLIWANDMFFAHKVSLLPPARFSFCGYPHFHHPNPMRHRILMVRQADIHMLPRDPGVRRQVLHAACTPAPTRYSACSGPDVRSRSGRGRRGPAPETPPAPPWSLRGFCSGWSWRIPPIVHLVDPVDHPDSIFLTGHRPAGVPLVPCGGALRTIERGPAAVPPRMAHSQNSRGGIAEPLTASAVAACNSHTRASSLEKN